MSKVGNQTNSQDPQAVNSRTFVGNLNTFQCTKTDVERMFQRYGRIAGEYYRGRAWAAVWGCGAVWATRMWTSCVCGGEVRARSSIVGKCGTVLCCVALLVMWECRSAVWRHVEDRSLLCGERTCGGAGCGGGRCWEGKAKSVNIHRCFSCLRLASGVWQVCRQCSSCG